MIQVTNEYYGEYDEWERYVSGEHNSATIYDDHTVLSIGGMPDIELTTKRMADLRDVLAAAVAIAEQLPNGAPDGL
jgi:hypothetical protein